MYIPLNRERSKRLAIFLIAAGILLAPDIIVPTPLMDALLNVPIAMFMATVFNIGFFEAVLWTFTFSFTLMLAGLLIYPYNTKRLIVGRLKAGASFMMANPMMAVIAIVAFFVVYLWGSMIFAEYEVMIREYTTTLISTLNGGA